MAQIIGYVAMSHSPFWDESFDITGPGSKFAAGAALIKEKVQDLNPDLIVIFGPDHMRNFFFDLMPAFCIGAGEVVSFGDYGGHKGHLPHMGGIGRKIVDSVRGRNFDPAFSLRMGIDHGIVQPYEVLLPEMTTPVLPIMVDCGAEPRPSMRRAHEFGRAVGESIRALDEDLRVLVISSGGLSHWVKAASPYDESIDDQTREFLIDGRDTVVEYNAAREAGLAERIAAGHEGDINEEWDRWFLDKMTSGDLEPLLAMDTEEMERIAGNGAHEVRTWIAGLGAWNGPVETVAYEPVHRWVTGMGLVAAFTESTRND
ncbi:hypothetical protein QNO08_14520 [Arthrobacter sp. zg-Y820]|uniref:DODA-type extradiol aromatic ring-opening family dioxygenase n=1 Tax=unclassified Arthrobacter TaxID=235627 RepID=UPI001E40CEB2|nr:MULTISPECIES: hypothetical protein [unclassified Arthrobacter]MCC9195677.1 hypothetical protein [Arthrobacter sp. zg-Y820]MDK1278536.1 hypothetical protein [Arthrobacter sp. zg.Y820]WIB09028.1 hypothetical protein QNO08_14520 [Arthrobacter sp. zg-Y820]